MNLDWIAGTLSTIAAGGVTWLGAVVRKHIAECNALAQRISDMEAANGCDFPQWVRDADGVFVSVNVEFMRVAATPLGYRKADLIGKKFEQLTRFSPDLRTLLDVLDKQALASGYACAHGVQLHHGRRVTILKTTG